MGDDRNRGSNFVLGVILGALVGAGSYWFLTSTEEGKKVKKQIQKKGEEALDNLADMVEDLEEKGEEFKEKAQEVQKELEEKTQSLKEEVADRAQEGLEQIEDLRQRGQKAAAKFFTKNGKPLN